MVNTDNIRQRILSLKSEKNALILAHYYQPLEVQDMADHVCDSFEMAKRARDAEQQIIVICGVVFMGESAKILNPGKKILIPVMEAGCPMADMVTPEDVINLRKKHPDAAVVCYVNSSAAVKAVSDICCTSSSVLRIVRSLPEKKIIFIPDRNLGAYVARQVPEKEIILFDGFCPTHNRVTESDALRAKEAHPDSVFAAHPECRQEVLAHADFIGSTSEIINYAHNSEKKTIIIGTEQGIVERLRRELPDKNIYSVAASFVCPNMKKTNLPELLNCLENEQTEIKLTDEEIAAAKQSLDRMVSI
ncbi:MAG: quinolinate synthase NadA [Clostridiales bacterium]|jgi:quinolinate synthase|nr:quinolinate synthase NadA [Clostridiales bacterium]